MKGVRFELPARGSLTPNNEHDPLPYYYHPWIGWLFRHRLRMGLSLLPEGGSRVLEVGVGSGILVPTLTRRYSEYTGTDLELALGLERLVFPGCRASFRRSDLLRDGDLPESSFDAIVCFSVLEHIADSNRAALSLARALAPGGRLVTGYPMVSPLMTRAFRLVGFREIEEHHVSPPAKISGALARHLRRVSRVAFPPGAPVRAALYQCTSWAR